MNFLAITKMNISFYFFISWIVLFWKALEIKTKPHVSKNSSIKKWFPNKDFIFQLAVSLIFTKIDIKAIKMAFFNYMIPSHCFVFKRAIYFFCERYSLCCITPNKSCRPRLHSTTIDQKCLKGILGRNSWFWPKNV